MFHGNWKPCRIRQKLSENDKKYSLQILIHRGVRTYLLRKKSETFEKSQNIDLNLRKIHLKMATMLLLCIRS